MKNWFVRNRFILISFVVITLIVLILTMIQVNLITQPQVLEDLNGYIETNEISSALKKYVVIAFITLFFFGVWGILFFIIMWRVLFPTNKTLREAFHFDGLEFLYRMPSNLKKELKRDE